MSTPNAALATLALVLGACSSDTKDEQPRSVTLVTLDTTRADFVGSRGTLASLTPNLDALAREDARFEMAISASAVTPVSTTPENVTLKPPTPFDGLPSSISPACTCSLIGRSTSKSRCTSANSGAAHLDPVSRASFSLRLACAQQPARRIPFTLSTPAAFNSVAGQPLRASRF
jgi:hypothetical protein